MWDEFSFSMGGKSNARGWHKFDGYESGSVATPRGLVDVYMQPAGDRWQAATVFDFCYRDRHYVRTYRRAFSRRYCVTLASRFAADIQRQHRA